MKQLVLAALACVCCLSFPIVAQIPSPPATVYGLGIVFKGAALTPARVETVADQVAHYLIGVGSLDPLKACAQPFQWFAFDTLSNREAKPFVIFDADVSALTKSAFCYQWPVYERPSVGTLSQVSAEAKCRAANVYGASKAAIYIVNGTSPVSPSSSFDGVAVESMFLAVPGGVSCV